MVELLIVILIIGILFIVLVSKIEFTSNNARRGGTQNNLNSYITAATSAAMKDAGFANNIHDLTIQLNEYLDKELQLSVAGDEIITEALDGWGVEYKIIYAIPPNSIGELTIVSAGNDKVHFTKDDEVVVILYCSDGAIDVTYPLKTQHDHQFDKYTTGNAMKKPLTCQSPAVYYYTCGICQMKSSRFFEHGEIDPNAHFEAKREYVFIDDEFHTIKFICGCGEQYGSMEEEHTITFGECIYCREFID
jgi:type II secretory pathway pseudopilin PulG